MKKQYYNFVCLPDNLLLQTFEDVVPNEVTGRVFIYVDGCLNPKSDWKLMPNDGYLYWHGYLDPSLPTWIDDIVVSERHRRRGLGSILVMNAEKRIKAFGLTHVEGIATEEGGPFWESHNYAVDKESSRFYKSLKGVASTIAACETQYSSVALKEMARKTGISPSGSKRKLCRTLIREGVLD